MVQVYLVEVFNLPVFYGFFIWFGMSNLSIVNGLLFLVWLTNIPLTV